MRQTQYDLAFGPPNPRNTLRYAFTPRVIEAWDAVRFPNLPVRLSFKDLANSLAGMSVGHDGTPVEFKRERVVATGEGEVLRGHVSLAQAIVESWCADNPVLFIALLEGWIERARAADDADRDWHRRWEDRIAYNPNLATALDRGPAVVCERAGLTAFQTRAVELMLDGKTKTEIGVLLGMSRQGATKHLENALEKILAMDRDGAAD